jgi:hypothetical protein
MEIAVLVLKTGKVQRVEHTVPMCNMWWGQRTGSSQRERSRSKVPQKNTGSASVSETHVTVDGAEMPRVPRHGRLGIQSGSILWVVSKCVGEDGNPIAFACEYLDDRDARVRATAS